MEINFEMQKRQIEEQ
jgi:hypothetical protein